LLQILCDPAGWSPIYRIPQFCIIMQIFPVTWNSIENRVLGGSSLRHIVLAALLLFPGMAMADEVKLHAAGSLKAALGEVAANFEKATGHKVVTAFGPSGLLRERIEKGEPAEVFASANMKHPQVLEKAGKAGPVRMFAR